MKKIKPHQKVLYDYAIRIFNGTLKPGEKLPPLKQISEKLGVDHASLKIGLHRLVGMNLLRINEDSAIYVNDYRDCAGIDFLRTLFDCQALWPDKNIIGKNRINEVWTFWSLFLVEIIRIGGQKATLEDLKPIVDIFDQELSNIHNPVKLLELEVILCDYLVDIADNLMLKLLYNSTRRINHKLIAMFVHTIEPETLERYTTARKQMVSVFASGLSTELNSTLESFRELIDNLWLEHHR